MVLNVCLVDPNVPRDASDRVYWTWEDVDDPADDPVLDPNEPDNVGGWDSSDPFTQEGFYSIHRNPQDPNEFDTIYDGLGCSKVRFHPTDAPGDNFRVNARLRTGLGEVSVTSQTMTLWKRVHVELDSMGLVTEVEDSDDAVIPDVPDPPASDLVKNAFAPAYIEVVFDGPGPTTNAPFDHHVPDFFTNDQDPTLISQIALQGRLGRNYLSATGSWRLYAQGTYEGEVNLDNDPDQEIAVIGITNGLRGRYSLLHFETLRDTANENLHDETYLRQAVLLHEFGHQFALDHEDTIDGSGGIMEFQGFREFPYFTPSQLRQIRTIGVPPPGYSPAYPSSEE